MSAPLRFLALSVALWVGVRAGGQVLMPPPLPEIPVPPLGAAAPNGAMASQPEMPVQQAVAAGYPMPQQAPPPGYGYAPYPYGYGAPYPMPHPAPVQQAAAPRMMPVYYPVPMYQPAPSRMAAAQLSPVPGPGPDFEGVPVADEAPMSRMAAAAPRGGAVPTFEAVKQGGLDRLSLSSWGLFRQQRQVIDLRGPQPVLASGGTLGGSQAGARLTYRFSPALGINLRASAPVIPGQRRVSGEAALGLSWQPLQSVPVRLMAERRRAFGGPEGGGRNAFALLAEGGVYGRSLPWGFQLDGYGQTGVVGTRTRDWFVDGGVTSTRPFMKRFALGAGVWGGAQPGLARLDVGPRLSMQVRRGIRAHLDYRYRALGRAEPGSGAAITVASDF